MTVQLDCTKANLTAPSVVDAAPSEPMIFRPFDPETHGEEFGQILNLYWLEVARDRVELEIPRRKRTRLPRSEWGRLVDFEYITLGKPSFSDMIILDVDDKKPDAAGALNHGTRRERERQLIEKALAMPVPPNLIGYNGARGRRSFQMIWYLDRPAYSKGWERDAHKAVSTGVRKFAGGDGNFTHGMSRNPMSLVDLEDGYFWSFSDWRPRSWHEMTYHYAADTFARFETVHQDIIEQSVRIDLAGATGQTLFSASRDGRKTEKPVMAFDSAGVQRKDYIFRYTAWRARSLMYTGQPVTVEVVSSFVLEAVRELSLIDKRPPLSERRLQRYAREVATWVNEKMRPGDGRHLHYGQNSKYTREQSRLGGQITAQQNVDSGRWQDEIAPKGPRARSNKSAERYAERYAALCDAFRAGNTNVTHLAAEFELSRPTVNKVLKNAGLKPESTAAATSRPKTRQVNEQREDSVEGHAQRPSRSRRNAIDPNDTPVPLSRDVEEKTEDATPPVPSSRRRRRLHEQEEEGGRPVSLVEWERHMLAS